MKHTYIPTPRLIQKTCIVCNKEPKNPLYVNIDDFQSISKRIYPICKRCANTKTQEVN